MYRNRTLEEYFLKASTQFPVMMVTGPRQVGKTTFLKHLCENDRTYVTLDDPAAFSLAKEDPGLFLQRFRPPVLIDEIQYAPELLPMIKLLADREQKPGLFWLTGSQQFRLMKNVSESLAGRVCIIDLLGFSRREQDEIATSSAPFVPESKFLNERMKSSTALSLMELYARVWRGSFPAVVMNPEMDKDLYYSSYVQTYLQRDVRDLANVGDEAAFLRFLRAAAARTGQLLNLSEIGRDTGVSSPTAKHWLSILQASGIVYLLEPYFTNVTKRLIKAPKLYFLDTGLCSYLTEWSSPQTLEVGAMNGAVLETWIVAEIIKSYWHNGRRAPIWYYRDKDKKEIDLLIIQDGKIHPLEFKKSAAPSKGAVKNFKVLERLQMPIGSGGVICLADSLMPLTDTISSIPVSFI